jgi:hypothetical protein
LTHLFRLSADLLMALVRNVAFVPGSSMRSTGYRRRDRAARRTGDLPGRRPTARSAMVVSSVSPERCEMIVA